MINSQSNSRSPLRVISLGGIGKMGKNMTLFEQRDEILIVDCGLMFPDEDKPGVDLVIPDMTYVLENAERVAGVLLTHGHEDHMGALPFLLEQIPAIVWGTPLTLGLLENRLSEFSPLPGTELVPIDAGEMLNIGSFVIEVVRVNHSVRDGVGLGIQTDQGLVVHTGDYKFDQTPVDGVGPDYQALARFGGQRPIALITDCTNVERPGFAGSEREVGETFKRLFAEAQGRIIVTSFASHIARIEQVFSHSQATGRKVAVAGRSMIRNIETSKRLGMLDIPPGVEVPIDVASQMPPEKVTILASGSQGEPFSALTRMSQGEHRWIEVTEGDTVIISASAIPGNESIIHNNIDQLFRNGARVISGPDQGVHVSGHAYREEQKLMLGLTTPEYVIPIHGDYRHLVQYRDLAADAGIPEDRVLIMDMGIAYEFEDGQARRVANVPAGSINVDGLGVGDVGDVVISDRHWLSENGIVLPVLALDAVTKQIVGGPDIYSRGFVYMSESEDIIDELKETVLETYHKLEQDGPIDPEELYDRLRSSVAKCVGALTGRRPMIVPVIIPVGEMPPDGSDE